MSQFTDEGARDRRIRTHIEKARTEILRVTEPDSTPSVQLALEELLAAVEMMADRSGVPNLRHR